MTFEHEGKRYDTETSTVIHGKGLASAMSLSDGFCKILKTPKGAVWALTLHWPDAYGSQSISFYAGTKGCVRALKVTRQENYLTDELAKAIGYEIEDA